MCACNRPQFRSCQNLSRKSKTFKKGWSSKANCWVQCASALTRIVPGRNSAAECSFAITVNVIVLHPPTISAILLQLISKTCRSHVPSFIPFFTTIKDQQNVKSPQSPAKFAKWLIWTSGRMQAHKEHQTSWSHAQMGVHTNQTSKQNHSFVQSFGQRQLNANANTNTIPNRKMMLEHVKHFNNNTTWTKNAHDHTLKNTHPCKYPFTQSCPKSKPAHDERQTIAQHSPIVFNCQSSNEWLRACARARKINVWMCAHEISIVSANAKQQQQHYPKEIAQPQTTTSTPKTLHHAPKKKDNHTHDRTLMSAMCRASSPWRQW